MSDAPVDRLRGITESDYQSWRHHPVTQMLLQYLGDFREATVRETIQLWVFGTLDLPNEQYRRARIILLQDMIDLKFSDIELHYREATPVEDIEQSGPESY